MVSPCQGSMTTCIERFHYVQRSSVRSPLLTSAMNHMLGANKENEQKHRLFVCIFCNKGFSNHQAIGSHLMAHQEAMRSGNNSNHFDNSSTSIGINASNVSSNLHNPTAKPSGGFGNNMSTTFNEAASSSPPSDWLCSSQSGPLDATSFSEYSLRNLNNRFIMSPNLSSGYGHVEFDYPQCLPSIAISPFDGNAAAGFPLDPSYLGPNGVFQYNIGECQSCLGGMCYFPSADTLQNFQYPNLSNLPFPPSIAVDYPYPVVGSNQFSFFEDPTACGLLPHEFGQHNKSNTMKSKGNKRLYLGDVPVNSEMTNVSKKSKIGYNPHVSKERGGKKEVSLFKAVENPTSGIASSSVGYAEIDHLVNISHRLKRCFLSVDELCYTGAVSFLISICRLTALNSVPAKVRCLT